MQPPRIPNLTVSILVKYYCKINTNCLETTQIKNIIKIFESSLSTSINAENSNEILLALSSLGNVGYSHKTDLITSIFMVYCDSILNYFDNLILINVYFSE